MKKKMNQATIKTNADVARDAATDAKDYADKAAESCRGAVANAADARVHANVAKNASADAQRYYLSAKTCAEDAVELRRKAGFSMDEAAHEARSAMRCVVWCFCAAVLSLLFLIAHFIL